MRLPVSCLALLLTGAALLPIGCRSGIEANFEAQVSLAADPGVRPPSEETVAAELRARAKLLALPADIDPASSGDGLLNIRFRAKSKEEALQKLDALCQSGVLSVRAVHDQSVYLADAARTDPSKLPPGYEIMTNALKVEEREIREELVVASEEIVGSREVTRAEARRSSENLVLISLNVKGGRQMEAATEKMRKGRSRLAIIYDERIISAPLVVDVLASEFSLEGFNSFEEAQAVAASLNKPLSSKLLIESLKALAP